MKRRTTEQNVINKYDVLTKRQQELLDEMANLGREKDYKVEKIEREYNSKIEIVTKELQATALQIETVQRYVAATGDSDNPIVRDIKKPKKERS